MRRKLTAIMAADVAEFTRITAEDEEETLARLASYRQVIDDVVSRAGGRVFNSGGDSVMCEFPSVVEATRCAIDIQEILRTRNLAYAPGRQMHFRIGISIGDVVERDGDLLGDGVNVAARLQSLAEPGSICVSRNVQEAVSNKISLPFRDLGFREVKNLPHPVHVFQIDMLDAKSGLTDAATASVSPSAQAATADRRLARHLPLAPLLWLVCGVALAAGGAGLLWTGWQDRARTPPVASPIIQPPAQAERPAAPGASIVVTENLTPAEAFEKLAKSGGLVKDAASPAELYHNARLFEARGESANARRDYLAFAALGTGYIDPLLRLAALIRAQDGRAGAREIMAGFASGQKQDGILAARLVHILQFDGAERTSRLSAFAAASPGFAPAQHFLAVDLGDDRQNTQTIDEKRREQAALSRFLDAEREGRLVPHVLDQSILAGWLERAQKRDEELKAFFAGGRDRISLQLQRVNAGWLGSVSLPEAAVRLEYRSGGGDFQTTGLLQVLDPRTGRAMPNPGLGLPPDQRATTISLRYVDAMGVTSAVTDVAFDPVTAAFLGMRQQLEQNAGSWLAFGDGQNRHHLYLTQLLSYRCVIERVEIGFNGEVPRQVIALPPCDPANPLSIPATARAFIPVTADTASTTIRLTFVGGETSDIRTYPRPK